jgi:ubiquinone/menaquinone biosynthesis C-methylase UbiE
VGFYTDRILPRVTDVLLASRRMQRVRRPALEGLSGTVVEIGFGSGPNAPLYPPEVELVYAIEPSEVARGRAARRVAESNAEVRFVGLDGEHLPLDDASADNVLSTWTLCTIPDVDQAMREVKRVLVPGGRLHFLEHGLSEEPKVEKWQHRLTPIQRRIGGGCHLDRDIAAIVGRSGLRIERLSRFTISGPKTYGTMFCGVAVKPDDG